MEIILFLWWNVYEFRKNPENLEQTLLVYSKQNDILALSEYRPDKISPKVRDSIINELPYYKFIPYGKEKKGMAFFSKEPLNQLSVNYFKSSNRYLVDFKYKNTKFYTTHLKQHWLLERQYSSDLINKANVLREIVWGKNNLVMKQARELFKIIEKENEDHILLGDFNVFPKFLFFKTLFYKELEDRGYHYKVTKNTWGSKDIPDIKGLPYLTLDQVFVKGNQKIFDRYKIDENSSSDHRPIKIRIWDKK